MGRPETAWSYTFEIISSVTRFDWGRKTRRTDTGLFEAGATDRNLSGSHTKQTKPLIGLAGGLSFAELTISDGGGADTTISITSTSEILTVVQSVTQDLLTTDDFTTIV